MRNRIGFLGAVFLILSQSCATSSRIEDRAPAGPNVAPAESDRPVRVIDAHVHVRYSGKKGESTGFVDSADEFSRQLLEVNGKAAIAHTSASKIQKMDYGSLKIIPCLGISKNPDLQKVEAAVKNGPFRCFKVYLGYQYQWANHPNYKAVYRIAEKHGVPVVFHTGDTLDANGHLKYADPLTIDEVAVEFRKVKFVIAHIGNPWIQSAAEVAYKNANVFIDVSALLIGDLSSYSPESLERYVVEPIRWTWGYVENPKKLMFGTDWPLVRIVDYLDVVKKAVPKEHWDRFFYLNAAEVFGIQ